MNNYCTNCGKKLEKNEIKCENCNTYVVDIKKIQKDKIFKTVCITIAIIVFVIIFYIIASILLNNISHRKESKSIYEEYLKNDYKEAKYVKYDYCYKCSSSCDSTCTNYEKIDNCFKYYYKSNSKLKEPDILVFSYNDQISITNYSYLTNNYSDGDDDDYLRDELMKFD